MSTTSASIELYTDGSCLGNPGPGGWAVVQLTVDAQPIWYAGHEDHTTNNRMEILAAIKGLERTPRGSRVVVYSDSQYLVNTIVKQWRTKANLDLWEQLRQLLAEREVSWQWVQGHADVYWNQQADRLAQAAAQDPTWRERSGRIDDPLPEPSPPPPSPQLQLSHLDEQDHARMVDVSEKAVTDREAVARGAVFMAPETLQLIQQGGIPKGDVLTVAQIAGIMGAKRTSDLIPLCHPLALTGIELEFRPDEACSCVEIAARVKTADRTGVEMEALTAVTIAALTIYDMCKAVDRGMRISEVRVTYKAGGKSGLFEQV